ncbi:hypothetical protein SL10_01433 [Klebsiella pneumoniae]|nr:hypothetical protein SL10_01433 [Klebsiella pneumoniae]
MKSELAEVANDMVDTNKKYLIWNNKGGVGKTFLTYNLAVEYAIAHSDEDVVVIGKVRISRSFLPKLTR